MTQRRGDVDAFVPFLPQTNHRDIDTSLDRGDIGQSLATDRRSATDLGSTRNLSHSLGVAHGLPRVSLNGNDELSFKTGNKRMHGELLCVEEERNSPEQRCIATKGTDKNGGSCNGRHGAG